MYKLNILQNSKIFDVSIEILEYFKVVSATRGGLHQDLLEIDFLVVSDREE